jgi:hypothetical protein
LLVSGVDSVFARTCFSLGVGLSLAATSGRVGAEGTIRSPGDHVAYDLELEPHLVAGFFDPPGVGRGVGYGVGVRASWQIAPAGFLPAVNDSVAIGAGLDFAHYAGSAVVTGFCRQFVAGPNGTSVCVDVDGRASNYFFIPVVMQWSFWLTHRWSLFGEPGVALYVRGGEVGVSPALFLGARYQLSDAVAFVLRIGYPSVSLGASFFF